VSAAGAPRSAASAPLPEPALAALPGWDFIDIEKYRRVWNAPTATSAQHGVLARLFFRCNWCAKPIWGNHTCKRRRARIAAEMIHLRRHYRPDQHLVRRRHLRFKVIGE